MSQRNNSDMMVVWVVLGFIGVSILGTILFYGTIAAIALHFIHKFW
jgi:hypothetical protein